MGTELEANPIHDTNKRLHIDPLILEIVPDAYACAYTPTKPRRLFSSLKVKLRLELLQPLKGFHEGGSDAASFRNRETNLCIRASMRGRRLHLLNRRAKVLTF